MSSRTLSVRFKAVLALFSEYAHQESAIVYTRGHLAALGRFFFFWVTSRNLFIGVPKVRDYRSMDGTF
jgi:hypothetical protein